MSAPSRKGSASKVMTKEPQSLLWLIPHAVYLTISLGFVGLAVYLFDYRPPMLLSNGHIVDNELTPGITTMVHWDQDWQRLCPGEVTRTIEKANGWRDVSSPFPIIPPDKPGKVLRNAALELPTNLPPGPSTYYSTISFYCNPLQRLFPIVIRSPDVPFVVIAKGQAAGS